LSLIGTALHVQHIEACPDIGPICATTPQTPYQHDQHLYTTDLSADFELGLAPNLALHILAGIRQVTDRIQYLDLEGAAFTPPIPDTHHRNETIIGPTDPWIMMHFGTDLDSNTWIVSAQGGITLPFGSTVANPFRLGDLGIPHEHVQLGTGTVDLVTGLSIERRFEALRISAWTLDRFTVFTNRFGYKAGHRLLGALQASSPLGTGDFDFTLGIDLFREMAETWSGVVESEGNLGRTDLFADAGIAWRFADGYRAMLDVKVPFWTHATGEQVHYPAILTLGIALPLLVD
jgi:hypothetical protein